MEDDIKRNILMESFIVLGLMAVFGGLIYSGMKKQKLESTFAYSYTDHVRINPDSFYGQACKEGWIQGFVEPNIYNVTLKCLENEISTWINRDLRYWEIAEKLDK